MSNRPAAHAVRPEPVEGRLRNLSFDKLRTNGSSVKADFPGMKSADGANNWHYLDTAATAQKPQGVIDAMARAMGDDYATVHRGVYARSANMTLA